MTQSPYSRANVPGEPGSARDADGGATKGVVDQAQDKVGQVVGKAQDKVGQVADKAQDTVAPAVDQAQQAAGQVADQAKQQASSQLENQKGRAVDSLVSVAQALRQTSQHLHEQEQGSVAGYLDQIAEQTERFTNYLRARDVGEVVDDTEDLARRQPGLFVAGAVALGFLGGRFLMTSGQRAASRRRALPSPYGQYGSQPYASSRGQTTAGQAYPYGTARGATGNSGAAHVETAAEDLPHSGGGLTTPGMSPTSGTVRDDPRERRGPGAQGV